MAHSLTDKNRRPLDFKKSLVQEILPEYFQADNPTLVSFLEQYYNFLDSDGVNAFDEEIHTLTNARDIGSAHQDYLKYITSEIGGGLTSIGNFTIPRFALQRLAQFYRTKGSRWSIEEFFRLFFQDNSIEVSYPKHDMFIVGQDKIGTESLKFIQNYARYQIFSILIKSSRSVAEWQDLYKQYVHPAGFYFEGEVLYEAIKDLDLLAMPIAEVDSAAGNLIVSDIGSFSAAANQSITYLFDLSDDTQRRGNLAARIKTYQNKTARELNGFYKSIEQLMSPNSVTFDDSALSNFGYDGKPARAVLAGATTSTYTAVNDSNEYQFGKPFGGNPWDGRWVGFLGNYMGWGGQSTNGYLWWNRSIYSVPELGPSINGVFVEMDYTKPYFDSSAWVNPEHLVGADVTGTPWNVWAPGGLLRGQWIKDTYPNNVDSGVENFYYRIDSDAYYYHNLAPGWNGGPAANNGDAHPGPNLYFALSRLQWPGKDSSGADFSHDGRTMDHEMFTRYLSDSAF